MPEMITIPEYVQTVLTRLEEWGYEAYVVGGCVRDSLMGREPKDWDVCTSAPPSRVLAVFRRFHVIKTGLQHGTVTVMSSRRSVEVTTFRIDGQYTDNRHPDAVTFVSRVEEDLARRDFTVNAMAYSPSRGLVDAFGGCEDLRAHLIRCVGEPDARFQEDGLRLLRALRFASRYGFDIERETAYAIRRNRHLLEQVSAERIFTELKGILTGAGVLGMLLAFPEVFAVFLPEITPCIGFDQHNEHHIYDVWTHIAHSVQAVPPEECLRLAMLLHDIAKPECFTRDREGRGHFYGHPERGAEMAKEILIRLKSDHATMERVVTLVREHDDPFPETRAGMRRLIGRLGEDVARQLFAIKRADHAAQSHLDREAKAEELRCAALLFEEVLEDERAFTVKDLEINGRDLIEIGICPGPEMGRLLAKLLNEVQEEQLENSKEKLRSRALELMEPHP